MAGIKYDCNIRTGRLFTEIIESTAHALQVAVGFEDDLKTQFRQRPVYCLGVIDGIIQRPDVSVSIRA